MKLTSFQIKLAWGVGIGAIICLWIAFPYIFKQLLSYYTFPENFNQFGAFGDIYGSLNTLISSIALCAVAFSTWLQVTSLKETRDATARQLDLAEKNHKEQIRESQYAIFSNMFYALLNSKSQRLQTLNFKNSGIEYPPEYIFERVADKFLELIETNWKNIRLINVEEIETVHYQILDELTNGSGFANSYSYFLIYSDLFELINRSELKNEDKLYFKQIVINSMSICEQIYLFWESAYRPIFKEKFIKNNGVFSHFYSEDIMPFAIKFYDKSCFSNINFHFFWDDHTK